MPWPPGWRWSKLFWILIWGLGPKKLWFYVQRTGALSFVAVITSLLFYHNRSVKLQTSKADAKWKCHPPASSNCSALLPWGAESRDGRLQNMAPRQLFPTEPYCYLPLRRDLSICQEHKIHENKIAYFNTWANKITAKCEGSSHSECKRILKQDKDQV